MNHLNVWMNAVLIGELQRSRNALRFEHSAAALQLGIGAPLVSVAMPVRAAAVLKKRIARLSSEL